MQNLWFSWLNFFKYTLQYELFSATNNKLFIHSVGGDEKYVSPTAKTEP